MSGHGKVYDAAVLHSGTTLAINMRISYLVPATNLYKHGSWSAVTNQPDNIFKRFIEKEALTWITRDLAIVDPRFHPRVGEVIVGVDGQDCRHWTSHQFQLYLEELKMKTLNLACESGQL